MKQVKLKRETLVGTRVYKCGDWATIDEVIARRLVSLGHAEYILANPTKVAALKGDDVERKALRITTKTTN